MSGDNFGLQTASGHLDVPAESKVPYPADVEAGLREDAAQIIARYPQSRSALLPMLHLVQSVDGYITGRGIELCAELLELSSAEVSGVATFYTQFKRHPNGSYTVGVCTNTLCAVMGGDQIWETVSEHLGIGHDETTEDGVITLERLECNAACDYAPVVMTNWEFFDNQTPSSTLRLVDDLRAGVPVAPTRGPERVRTFKEVSRVLAGFHDGLADEGVGAGPASLLGLRIAQENGWQAPAAPTPSALPSAAKDPGRTTPSVSTPAAAASSTPKTADGDAPGRPEVTQTSPEAAVGTQAAPEATDRTDEARGAEAKDTDEVTAPDSAANEGHDEIQGIGMTDPDAVKGDGEGETK